LLTPRKDLGKLNTHVSTGEDLVLIDWRLNVIKVDKEVSAPMGSPNRWLGYVESGLACTAR
jgi:hypothetical protein